MCRPHIYCIQQKCAMRRTPLPLLLPRTAMSPVLAVAEPKNIVREIDRISFLTYNYRNHNNWINWASFVILNGPSRQNSIRFSPPQAHRNPLGLHISPPPSHPSMATTKVAACSRVPKPCPPIVGCTSVYVSLLFVGNS